MTSAGGLGYWVVRETPVKPPVATDDVQPTPHVSLPAAETDQRFTSSNDGEVIDLSRVFEPTGDEFDLRAFLANFEPEQLPQPREAVVKIWQAPDFSSKTSKTHLPAAAEEESSLSELEQARRELGGAVREVLHDLRGLFKPLLRDEPAKNK